MSSAELCAHVDHLALIAIALFAAGVACGLAALWVAANGGWVINTVRGCWATLKGVRRG